MFDVIVVGGRCAGAATALILARKGFRVLVVDKARFPSEIPHGHFIHREGPQLLQRWGLLDKVVRSGCAPVAKWTTDFGDFPLTGTNLVSNGVALGYAPRRRVLDSILIEAAIESGAEFRARFSVYDYLRDGDSVSGIRGRSYEAGAPISERARITVGADGRHSSLARAVNAPVYEELAPLACWYFSYWSGAPIDGLEIYRRDRSVVFAFPTNDGLMGVFIGWPISQFGTIRQNIATAFIHVLEQIPELEQRIRAGKREERFYGTADLPNFFRKPYGPGWSLVGDAGYHKDPYTALGICDALWGAELLASSIYKGLSGKQSLTDAMASYEKQRNAAAIKLYQQNAELARFNAVTKEELAIRAALRGNQEEINRFYFAQEGIIPAEEFFNPDNLSRLKVRARALKLETRYFDSKLQARQPDCSV